MNSQRIDEQTMMLHLTDFDWQALGFPAARVKVRLNASDDEHGIFVSVPEGIEHEGAAATDVSPPGFADEPGRYLPFSAFMRLGMAFREKFIEGRPSMSVGQRYLGGQALVFREGKLIIGRITYAADPSPRYGIVAPDTTFLTLFDESGYVETDCSLVVMRQSSDLLPGDSIAYIEDNHLIYGTYSGRGLENAAHITRADEQLTVPVGLIQRVSQFAHYKTLVTTIHYDKPTLSGRKFYISTVDDWTGSTEPGWRDDHDPRRRDLKYIPDSINSALWWVPAETTSFPLPPSGSIVYCVGPFTNAGALMMGGVGDHVPSPDERLVFRRMVDLNRAVVTWGSFDYIVDATSLSIEKTGPSARRTSLTETAEPSAAPEPAPAEPAPETDSKDQLIESLREEVSRVRTAHVRDINTLNNALLEEAENRDWCSEFDEFVEGVNGHLNIELDGRERDFDVTVEVTYRVVRTVSARTESEAEDLATDDYVELDSLVHETDIHEVNHIWTDHG